MVAGFGGLVLACCCLGWVDRFWVGCWRLWVSVFAGFVVLLWIDGRFFMLEGLQVGRFGCEVVGFGRWFWWPLGI